MRSRDNQMKAAGRAAVLALALAAAAGPAAAMDIATFLPRAQALKAKGPLAMFSPDAGVLLGEINAATKQLRDERLAAKAAGRPQAYCPPPGAKTSLNTDELIAAAEAVPPGQRARTDLKDVLRGIYAKHNPCPA